MAIWRPVGITSVLSSGTSFFSVHRKIVNSWSNVSLTLDVFVVSAVSALLTEVEALLLTCHKRPDGDAVLFAHHTLGRGLVNLKNKYIFLKKLLFFRAHSSAASVVEEALGRLAPHGRVELVEVTAWVILTQAAAASAILMRIKMWIRNKLHELILPWWRASQWSDFHQSVDTPGEQTWENVKCQNYKLELVPFLLTDCKGYYKVRFNLYFQL